MNKKINQKKYLEALNFAFKLHSNQFRKGTKIPYFFHLSSVSNHVIENGGDTDEAIAGLLHDAVEDQGGEKTLKLIKKKFGNKVAKIVEDCTDTKVIPKPPWFERKKQYISDLNKKHQSSLLVSMCDKTHNASCIINDYYRVGKKIWNRFSANKKQVCWYYESLGKCYYKHLKGHKVLKQNFKKLVSEMKRVAK
jgi:(p)ppGpp synthase/HD superfamily hydrolase